MKATIIRPDGTRIEAEGTPEEVAKLAPQSTAAPVTFIVHCSCGMTAERCPVHGYSRWTGPVIYGTAYGTDAKGQEFEIILTNTGDC